MEMPYRPSTMIVKMSSTRATSTYYGVTSTNGELSQIPMTCFIRYRKKLNRLRVPKISSSKNSIEANCIKG
eukprot:4002601-Heterocapsa_arctica.AAC.1